MSSRPVPWFRLLVAAVAGLALFASAGTARADMVYIADTSANNQFTGSVTVTYDQLAGSANIAIQLTNTSTSPTAGYITGLAFNDPNVNSKGNINNVTGYSTDPTALAQQFTLIGGDTNYVNGINAQPYGYFDIGAAIGGNWEGGGNPTGGLAPGQSGTFTFTVTGQGLQNLTASNLLAAMSTNGTAGFVVRLRGIDGSYKDVAGGVSPPPPSGVPAPPGLVLAGVGFGCLLLGRLRIRRATPQA